MSHSISSKDNGDEINCVCLSSRSGSTLSGFSEDWSMFTNPLCGQAVIRHRRVLTWYLIAPDNLSLLQAKVEDVDIVRRGEGWESGTGYPGRVISQPPPSSMPTVRPYPTYSIQLEASIVSARISRGVTRTWSSGRRDSPFMYGVSQLSDVPRNRAY